jgi:predicted Zn-dependent peptidase
LQEISSILYVVYFELNPILRLVVSSRQTVETEVFTVANFRSTQVGRISVHVLPTTQFRTRQINIKLVHDMKRNDVTSVALLPYLWMEGTVNFGSSRKLMQKADDLYGAIVRTGIGKRGDKQIIETFVSIPEESSLPKAKGLFEQGKDLALEVLLHPLTENGAFPKQHVERELALHEKRIESIIDDKVAFAMERCMEEVYKGTAAQLPRLGFLNDLHSVSPTSLYEIYEQILSESEIHVYLVGHFADPQTLQNEILASFRDPQVNSQALQRNPILPLSAEQRSAKTVVDHQEVTQGKLNLGYRTGISYASPLYPAGMVMNGILGGFPHSKLFVNVREKESLAYYASSRLDSMTGALTVQTGIEIKNYDRALDIVLRQVADLQAGKIRDEEMDFTKRGLANQYRQLLDQPTALIDMHFNGILAGFERDIPALLEQISTVTKESVVEAANSMQLDTTYFLTSKEEL